MYLAVNLQHLWMLAYTPREPLKVSRQDSQPKQIGDISEGCNHAHEAPTMVSHSGHLHLNSSCFTFLGENIEGIGKTV